MLLICGSPCAYKKLRTQLSSFSSPDQYFPASSICRLENLTKPSMEKSAALLVLLFFIVTMVARISADGVLACDRSLLRDPVNGSHRTGIDKDRRPFAKFRCNSGYRLTGPKKDQCNSQGVWEPVGRSKKPRSCRKVISDEVYACNPSLLRDPVNGSHRMGKDQDMRPFAKFRCNTGYRLVGPKKDQCNNQGVWEPVGRSKKPRSCRQKPTPA